MFEQGDLRYVVLKLLAEKPAHGYEIIRAVEERFGGAYAPSPGIVYPTLTLLEEQGFIAVVETEGPRKLYGLTDEGRAELERSGADIDRVFARMSELRQRMGGGAAPEIHRAMENLKTALRLRIVPRRGRRRQPHHRDPRQARRGRWRSCDQHRRSAFLRSRKAM